jgi:hypothetical protein
MRGQLRFPCLKYTLGSSFNSDSTLRTISAHRELAALTKTLNSLKVIDSSFNGCSVSLPSIGVFVGGGKLNILSKIGEPLNIARGTLRSVFSTCQSVIGDHLILCVLLTCTMMGSRKKSVSKIGEVDMMDHRALYE